MYVEDMDLATARVYERELEQRRNLIMSRREITGAEREQCAWDLEDVRRRIRELS